PHLGRLHLASRLAANGDSAKSPRNVLLREQPRWDDPLRLSWLRRLPAQPREAVPGEEGRSMTAVATARKIGTSEGLPVLRVRGVCNPRSLGVAAYGARLAAALADEGVAYELGRRGPRDLDAHYHLANSSRAFLTEAATHRAALSVTVHDVLPRAPAL